MFDVVAVVAGVLAVEVAVAVMVAAAAAIAEPRQSENQYMIPRPRIQSRKCKQARRIPGNPKSEGRQRNYPHGFALIGYFECPEGQFTSEKCFIIQGLGCVRARRGDGKERE